MTSPLRSGERKTERLASRVTPAVKEIIERASAVSGLSAGDLAYEGARRILAEQEVMRITGADQEAFLAALLNPPAPTEDLISVLRDHRELFG